MRSDGERRRGSRKENRAIKRGRALLLRFYFVSGSVLLVAIIMKYCRNRLTVRWQFSEDVIMWHFSLFTCQSTVALITLRVFHKTKKCHYCCIHGPLFKLWRHRGESGQLFSLRLIDPSHAQNISLPKTLSPPQVFFTLSYTSSSPKAESLEILRKWCAWFVIVESLFWH